jgi:isopentenyldiphosphate isomerase
MTDELIDIYDENNKPLGISKMKSEAHSKGLWHRAAHVWIYNSNNEILFQLRAKIKKCYPDMWTPSAAGGHIGAGENEIEAIIRETEEEIGLKVKEHDLRFIKIMKEERVYKKMINNEFHYIYFFKFDGDISNLKLQKEEVDKVKFFSIDKIDQELENNPEKYLIDKDYWRKVSAELINRQ